MQQIVVDSVGVALPVGLPPEGGHEALTIVGGVVSIA
jgi:hypothetical protein